MKRTFWHTHLQPWLICFLTSWTITTFIGSVVGVGGHSMMPNLRWGERVLILKTPTWLHRLGMGNFKRGDVIAFNPPLSVPENLDCNAILCQRTHLIKRIVALPGDTVTLKAGKVYVNQQEVQETQLRKYWQDMGCWDETSDAANHAQITPTIETEIHVPNRHYFVLGDNRVSGGSRDSRSMGVIPIENIDGTAIMTLWPPFEKESATYRCKHPRGEKDVVTSGALKFNVRPIPSHP